MPPPPSRKRRPAPVIAGLAILSVSPARSDGPLLPLRVPSTGEAVALLGRSDGGFPFRAEAMADRVACLGDRTEVTDAALRAILGRARVDPRAAYRATLDATARCMAVKGWTTTPCGGGGPACPVGAGDEGRPEDPPGREP